MHMINILSAIFNSKTKIYMEIKGSIYCEQSEVSTSQVMVSLVFDSQ